MNAPIAPIRQLTLGAGLPALGHVAAGLPAPSRRQAAKAQGTPTRLSGWQSGFSLVELMVAMTIGLFLTATLGYVMLGAKASFNTLDALSRIQENARFAFETMAKDIRMAGFTGGPIDGGTPVNAVNSPGANTWDPNLINLYAASARGDGPLAGYEGGVDTFPVGVAGETGLTGDALTIVRADTDNEYALDATVANNCSGTNTCTLAAWPSSGAPAAGEIFVAADYTHSAVFQVSAIDSGSRTVEHGTGTVTPGNTVNDLGPFTGDIGARKLYRLSGVTYHVKTNPGGEPALYRLELGHSGTTANAPAVEVMEGVADMQIEYGEDTITEVAPNPQVWQINAYRTANSVVNWNRVLSVRVTLDLVSQQDGLLGKTITNTIAVRNRLLLP